MNKYSNNTGQPVKKVLVPNLSQTLRLFNSLHSSGKVFRIDFKKKNGELRTMVCRCGVHSKTNGKGMAYNPMDKGLMTVYEFGKGYRTVNLDTISFIKHEGVGYLMNSLLPFGEHSKTMFSQLGKTLRARTSPMYK